MPPGGRPPHPPPPPPPPPPLTHPNSLTSNPLHHPSLSPLYIQPPKNHSRPSSQSSFHVLPPSHLTNLTATNYQESRPLALLYPVPQFPNISNIFHAFSQRNKAATAVLRKKKDPLNSPQTLSLPLYQRCNPLIKSNNHRSRTKNREPDLRGFEIRELSSHASYVLPSNDDNPCR